MKIRDFWNKIKKPVTAAAFLLGLVLVIVALMGSASTTPANPMDQEEADASRMYVTSDNLAVDASLLENLPNANISGSGDRDQEEQEEEDQEEQEEQQEEQQSQTNPEEEQQEDQEETQNYEESQEDPNSPQTSNQYDSLISLIQKKNTSSTSSGGNKTSGDSDKGGSGDSGGDKKGDSGSKDKNPADGGTDATLTPEESGELFYTSIVDGETAADSAYYFTITLTERGKALTLVNQTVTVNGATKSFANGDYVNLQEGANQIQVTLRFRDKAYNQVDAPSKTYTVYYYKSNHYYLTVTNAKTNQEIANGATAVVTDGELWLNVSAYRGTDAVNARVRLNNGTVSQDSDGLYKTSLKVGNNALKITLGSGVNQLIYSATINYQKDDFSVQFESIDTDDTGNRINDVITATRFGGKQAYTWTSTSQNFRFRVSCSQTTGLEKIQYVGITQNGVTTDMTYRAGSSGYITMQLDGFYQDSSTFRGNTVYVEFLDSNGQLQNYTWIITFQRSYTPDGYEPYVELNLVDGQSVSSNPASLSVYARDVHGNTLNNWNFTVTLNGQEAPFVSITSAGYEYALYVDEGPNTLQVTVTDNEQYSKTLTLTINYSTTPETFYINLKLNAGVLGLGTWIDETIPVQSNQTIAQVVEERLAAYGFTTVYDGTVTDGYYLKRIGRSGMLEGWSLTEDQILQYKDEGYEVKDPLDLDSLGDQDMTSGSGWMVTLDGIFISKNMSAYKVTTGSTISVQFSLDQGKDLGMSEY